VASIGRGPFILVINPSFPAKTVPEFIAYAKPIQARSTWLRLGAELRPISRVNCSR
jgi:tripartite-type tricarboxylate transporter receptor subunit TctC